MVVRGGVNQGGRRGACDLEENRKCGSHRGKGSKMFGAMFYLWNESVDV